jgi:hypothetical protein
MNLDKDDRGAATVLRPKSEKLLRKPIRGMPGIRCRVFHRHKLAMNLTKTQYRKLGIFPNLEFQAILPVWIRIRKDNGQLSNEAPAIHGQSGSSADPRDCFRSNQKTNLAGKARGGQATVSRTVRGTIAFSRVRIRPARETWIVFNSSLND